MMVDQLADYHMADLRPSPGLRAVVRVLLTLAFAVLILGFLVSGVAQITDALIQDTINDITDPDTLANNTTTSSDTHADPALQPATTATPTVASAVRPTFSRAPSWS